MSIYGFNDLAKVNSELKTTDIKGKEYAAVAERIRAFRKVLPEGFIITKIEKLEDGFVLISAAVGYYDEAGEPHTLGSGMAYEKEGSSNINRTSYIENCETSAVGRALGMAGFGLLGDVATADEVNRAREILDEQRTEDLRKQKIGPLRAVSLRRQLGKYEVEDETIFQLYKVRDLSELTEQQHQNIIEHMKDIVAIQKGEA